MNRLLRGARGLFLVFWAGSAFGATQDPIWLFTDSANLIYSNFQVCDTSRRGDFLCQEWPDWTPDTGDSYDGSKYINWEYQFSSDSFFVKDEFDATVIKCRDLRPGFAGFKTAWDYGLVGFCLSRYTYLIFAHKGPNENHKVTVRVWYNNGECGAPSYNEFLGTFAASSTWKLDTIYIPESVKNKPDKERNVNVYYEFVFIINNLDPNDTTSGPPGCLKVDDIRLAGCNPIDTSPKPQEVKEGESATFQVKTSLANPADIFTYQWKKEGVDIEGATDKAYTIASVKPADVGDYAVAVTVSSTGLTFTSPNATLTIKEGCGCGSGTGIALIPPLVFKAMARRKRKKKSPKTA